MNLRIASSLLTTLISLFSFCTWARGFTTSIFEWDPLFRIQASHRVDLFSAPDPEDLAANFIEKLKYSSLDEMSLAGLEKAKLIRSPWSGWHFPLNEGGLANRYSDPHFPKTVNWPTLSQYILDHLGQGNSDLLSPSEKYDLLLGDGQFTLTRQMVQIAANHSNGGSIDGWLGYCTGWANAAMLLPRPTHSVTVLARDGKTRIKFLPSDIKALGALLWANGSFPTRLVGTLCQESPVRRDPTTERALHPACRDTNPATWHLSVVNQLGVNQRSFIIDSDPGFEVWNQPISEYTYSYFNPATLQPASLAQAKVKLSEFKKDKFAAVRSPRAVSIVGVEMNLTFIYEKRPDSIDTDSPETDVVRVPIYKYDLELDASGQIIGGEWWTRIHPDVLWVVPPGARSLSMGDLQLEGDLSPWTRDQMVPASWVQAAAVSTIYTQPLARIVEKLFEWSASGQAESL